ncbi:MAG: hypothetical protein OXU64_04280 [Gemmatimonadota bacterium]|nr:hypothetical protein [Gemmatimonadota bacterium]
MSDLSERLDSVIGPLVEKAKMAPHPIPPTDADIRAAALKLILRELLHNGEVSTEQFIVTTKGLVDSLHSASTTPGRPSRHIYTDIATAIRTFQEEFPQPQEEPSQPSPEMGMQL